MNWRGISRCGSDPIPTEASLRSGTDFIRAQGATPGIQLGHSGRKARLTRPWEGQHPLTHDHPEMFDWEGWDLVAPSAIAHSDRMTTPRAFNHDEIAGVVTHWGEAAARAHQAGFDVRRSTAPTAT
jgi:2,4-dienoyl-CoA reductase-like NADH-dependent reductase (Old Yellow Enzyme family)